MKASTLERKKERRLDSGIPGWNEAFGGGFPESATYLLSGDSGIGKTTLLMRVAGRVAEQKRRPALYITSEQKAEKVRDAGLRSGAKLDIIYIWQQDEFRGIEEQIDRIQPACVVFDSVPMFDCDTSNRAEADRTIAKCGRRAADRHDALVFLLQHVTKAGRIGGTKRLQHEVDGVVFVRRREIAISKHRCGPTTKAHPWPGLKALARLAEASNVVPITEARSA